MDKIIQPCNPIVGVAKGQTATLDLSVGPRYHALWLQIIATAAVGKTLALEDLLGLITIKINGKPQRIHTAVELDDIQTSFGPEFAANGYNYDGDAFTWAGGVRQGPQVAKKTMFLLPIFFAEPWRKSYAATESMAWYTAWQNGSVLRSFQLELAVANDADVDGDIAITAYAETDNAIGPLNAQKQPIGLINRFERLEVPYTATGDLHIVTLEKRHICGQISVFMPAADDMKAVKVVLDNITKRDVTRAQNDQSLIARGFNEAGLKEDTFHIVFDYSDLPTDALILEGAREFKVIPNLTVAAPNHLVLLSQIYGPID